MNKEFGFEKLEVWQMSRRLTMQIYQLTNKFPSKEQYGLISQLNRATISISSNLAEGNSRFSNRDKSHFTEMAYSSLMEVLNQLILSNDLKYITDEELESMRNEITLISHKIIGFYKYQRNLKDNRDQLLSNHL